MRSDRLPMTRRREGERRQSRMSVVSEMVAAVSRAASSVACMESKSAAGVCRWSCRG